MFEQLLKALPSKQPSREGTGIAGRKNGNEGKPLSNGWDDLLPAAEDPWDSPKKPAQPQLPPKGDALQTPAFLNRLGGLGLQIDEFEQQSQRLGGEMEASGSERQSQVLSINDLNAEEFHPMILSNINNNFKTSMDRLLLMRIRNFVSDLRQTHQELKEYVEDQRTITEYFQEKLCLEVEDFFIEFRNQLQAAAPQPVQQSQLNDLSELLRQRNLQVQSLAKQTTQLRTTLQKQQDKNRLLRKTSIKKPDQPCPNCKTLQSKLATLRQECESSQQQMQKLELENQNLQEHLFDIEQKIVGIDLEVEKRLKEKTKHLQDLAYKPIPPPIKEDNHEQIDHLNEEITLLTQKCRRLETALQQKDQELTDRHHRHARIEESEQTLHRRETSLQDSLAKMQEQKQLNYVREHEILIAEENLSKKIADMRKKEVELSQWEVELARRANEGRQTLKDNTLAHQFEEGSYGNSVDELNRSDEMSLKSFGRHKNPTDNKFQGSPNSVDNLNDYHPPNFPNRHPTPHYDTDYELRPIPPLPLREPHHLPSDPHHPPRYDRQRDTDRQDRFALPRRNDSKKIIDSAYAPRSREHAIDANSTRGYGVGGASQYRDTRETSPYRSTAEPRLRPQPHQYTLPRTSPKHYRDASKNSRSSASKSIRTPHPPPSPRPRQPTQLSGLGSKLQRLRQQIKKEIDSIK